MAIMIDLVVIGKNSEDLLRKIYVEEYLSILRKYINRLIYVDSRSSDQSIQLMKDNGFDVCIVNEVELTAAAGRHVGTLVSQADYVLYLDSDMQLTNVDCFFNDFFDVVENRKGIGCVGVVTDFFPNGTKKIRLRNNKQFDVASSFGGFVILHRDSVIKAGNWNKNLFSNEEMDLYVRLQCQGGLVYYLTSSGVKHFTIVPSRLHSLLGVYLPLRKGRYGSLGKLLANQRSFCSTIKVINFHREVFLFISAVVFLFFSIYLFLIAIGILVVDVKKRKSLSYVAVVPGLAVSTVVCFLLEFMKKNKGKVVSYENV
ncbi:GT2 family glycosyltransferase [Kerstersia gyiorum]|uniref:GT2 family glycosyltransferase n=1 Tax=Kerstersia gyiorum TaxID=206506 RepID=A0A4Q7MH39_9BURK|nr:hypothetical protein [Kerstersia gyiorum]KAB0542991.1 hypothetical protein F7P85_10480 [Kerstersia gyiorum]RZS67484.1 GT2 family glycosyltransferase [Kerstersia gyiorum]